MYVLKAFMELKSHLTKPEAEIMCHKKMLEKLIS